MDRALVAHWRAFGVYLKRLLDRAGLTVSEFAERAGITLTQASRILNGQSGTRRTTLPRFIQALGMNQRNAIRDLYARAGFLPPTDPGPTVEDAGGELTYELDEAEREELISAFEGVPPSLRPSALRVLQAFIENLPPSDEDSGGAGRRRRGGRP